MKKRFFIAAIISVVFFFSCETTPPAVQMQGIETASDFMKANVPLISMHTLDNGITVIVKRQNTNRIFTMNIVYNGGLAMLPEGKDGLESLTLSTMIRGSKKYSFEDIKRISVENSSSMSASAGIDISYLSLSTIDKYWNTMLDMFTDAVLNPSFDPAQLELVKHSANMAIKKNMSDPYHFAVTKLHERSFKGHPYGKEKDGTEKSIKDITIDDLKNWHSEKLTAERMFIVAVGNFNPSKLVKELNKTLGKIPAKQNTVPEIKPFDFAQNVYTENFDNAEGIAYIRGDYVIPPVDSKDFTALRLAYSILDELLFEIVRTQKAACYSVWTNAHSFKAAYGSLVVFKSDKPTVAKLAFDEAIATLASGKTINLKGQGIKSGEGTVSKSSGPKYAPIEENIEAYKAKFINGFFSGQLTNAAAASQIIISYAYHGNPYEYLKFIDNINAVTAEDVVRVINQYLVNGKVSWIVVSDKEGLSKVDKSKFMQFTGTVKK
ncbi:M16 family metallopeptidase [Treponema pedis]|uniref:Peptidase M16 domain-containing protein n=5 Tax=Treponema pedis TaxID=409322 RepID=S5ZSN0_9SPIR|nr:pitrilysin family protein [Treponema pedis]AGT43090.1 peptidase M16 domain-containing protein [Treponema pedis str. T A4]